MELLHIFVVKNKEVGNGLMRGKGPKHGRIMDEGAINVPAYGAFFSPCLRTNKRRAFKLFKVGI